MSKIKVCHITHGIVGSGVEQVIFNYCSRMTDEFQFDVLYQYEPNPEILNKFQDAGFNCIQVPDKVHHPIKHLWVVYKIFKANHYKIVHSHLDYFMNSYICLLAMLAGIKKRIAHHHQAYQKKNLMLVLLCSILRIPCKLFSTDWLACGKAAAINGWGGRAVGNGRVTILPNAIDPEVFKFDEKTRQKIRSQYGIRDDDFVVGHVGRFFPQKNHDFLIDVFYEVYRQKTNAKLLLLGDGPLQEKIRQKVVSLGLVDFVIFAGLQKDPAPFYSAMDVFAFPSLYEGVPLTLVEAEYNGLPCAVSDNVTKEVDISNGMISMNLNVPVQEWAKILMTLSRKHNYVMCTKSQFDINEVFSELQMLYKG